MTNNDGGHGEIDEQDKYQQTEQPLPANPFPLSNMSLMHISFNAAHHNRINGGTE